MPPIYGNRSPTSTPFLPYRFHPHGEPMSGMLRWFFFPSAAAFASAGLGSKESTCDTPPVMKMKMTRLALPGKCGALGDSGSSAVPAAHNSDSIAGNNADPANSE